LKKNKIIKFKDHDHSYHHGQKKFISVNKLLGKYGFDFDEDYWLTYKAIESNVPGFIKKYFVYGFNFETNVPKVDELLDAFYFDLDYVDIDQEKNKIKSEWEQSSVLGTKFHKGQEDLAEECGYIVNPYDGKKYELIEKPKLISGYDNVSTLKFLKNLKDGAYSELLITSFLYGVAGQGDEVFIETVDGIRYVDIGDHKTNKKTPKYREKGKTCLEPIEHIYDCTFAKYWLQVSMYAYLLQILGYVVRTVGFYHYSNYDYSTKKVITVKYLEQECEDILNNFNKK
jgi:hypothetical protein